MSIRTDDLGRITQQTAVVAADGDRLGTVGQVYTSDATGEPAWVTLRTGLFGNQESFVPLADAAFDGDDIRVSVAKHQVHDAPRVDADGHLSVEEEDDLYRYYGLHNPSQPDVDPTDTDRTDTDLTDRTDTDLTDRTDNDRTDDDRTETDRSFARGDRSDNDRGGDDDPVAATGAGAAAATAAGAGVGAAATGTTRPDRDDELAQRDLEGRDEVAQPPDAVPRRAQDDDARPAEGDGEQEGVKPGERTTRLRRYVVTERVVQTIEELPDEPSS